jgi:hypothetical protein
VESELEEELVETDEEVRLQRRLDEFERKQ